MKTMLLALALTAATVSVPAFAADTPSAPAEKPAPMMHKAMPHKMAVHKAAMHKEMPAHEPTTDQLNQQQLDMHKS